MVRKVKTKKSREEHRRVDRVLKSLFRFSLVQRKPFGEGNLELNIIES